MGPPTKAQRAAAMPDITIPPKTWVNVYTASQIAVGTGLRVQGKSRAELLLLESSSQPSPASRDGRLVQYGEEVIVDAGSPGLWAFCVATGRAFVQGV